MSADYSTNAPNGYMGDPKRGAALGRPTKAGSPAYGGKLTLRHVPLNQGGYDRKGTYFGGGPGTLPLYWLASDDGTIDRMLRAHDRDDAKRRALELYPGARFSDGPGACLTFEAALAALRQGKRVALPGWASGTGPHGGFGNEANRHWLALGHLPDGPIIRQHYHCDGRSDSLDVVGMAWTPRSDELLAADWQILDPLPDTCPLCGEDRGHPSQAREHSCNRR